MPITRPNAEQVVELAASLGMTMTADEADAYLALMQPNFDAYDTVDALPDFVAPVKSQVSVPTSVRSFDPRPRQDAITTGSTSIPNGKVCGTPGEKDRSTSEMRLDVGTARWISEMILP